MAEPGAPQPERQLTVEEIKQLPEFIKICEQVYLDLLHTYEIDGNPNAGREFVRNLYEKLAEDTQQPHYREQLAAIKYFESRVRNFTRSEFEEVIDLNSADEHKDLPSATIGMSEAEIRAGFEKEGIQKMPVGNIPHEGGDINLQVVIADDGTICAREYIVERPGKPPERVKFDFGGLKASKVMRGSKSLVFKLTQREKTNPAIIHVERPDFLFRNAGVAARPVAYDRERGLYILPDGNPFAISQKAVSSIDIESGYARNADGTISTEFPVVEVEQIYNMQEPRGESVDKRDGVRDVYLGRVLSSHIYEKRLQYDALFAHYFRKTKLTELAERSSYALSYSRADRARAIKETREASKERPIDVVVSVSGGNIIKGLENIGKRLNSKQGGDDLILIAELIELHKKAVQSYEVFHTQQRSDTSRGKLEQKTHWDGYIRFFRRLDDADVKELFNDDNIRRTYFPSDLDGETAIQLFKMAGIRTQVVPFTPDQQKGGRAYIDEAVHLDISHGLGTEIIEGSASEAWGGVTIYLDEDDKKVLSSTHATYDHLADLGFLEQNRLAWYLIQFIDEEDSFRGLYNTQEGCKKILDNYHTSIFGIGVQLIQSGYYEDVIGFFKETIPGIEADVLKNNSKLDKNSNELRTAVLRKLATFDARPYFHGIQDKVNNISHLLEGKKDRSIKGIESLVEHGFVGETVFGNTLFDPFNCVEHQGRAAFAANYDCLITFNRQANLGIINLSPFQKKNVLHEIPANFYETDQKKPIGSVIKNKRFLVMNASSHVLTNFKQVVSAAFDYDGADLKLPKGVEKLLYTRNKREGDNLYREVVPEWIRSRMVAPDSIEALPLPRAPAVIPPQPRVEQPKPSVDLDDDPDPDPEEPELELPEELPAQFAEYQNGFNAAISEIAVNPMKFGPEAHELRQRIVGALMGMSSEVGTIPAPGKINPRFELLDVHERAMVEDITETMASAAGKLRASNIEQAIGAHDRTEFLRVFFDQAMIDAGLDIYEAVIDSEEIDEIFAEWVKTI